VYSIAGKTTLSSIIGCEISPTDGDVTVFGHSVVNEPYAVRGLVGVCKQFDYLYPSISAKEHLVLFAGLRGVPRESVAETVDKWLESVDLHNVQDQYSSGFSGGMRRRLSLACATIGGRPLLILDEPTTGMDPVSRRFVWKHIDAIKENRVVLLTTHAMEEADLLADSVAVSVCAILYCRLVLVFDVT
jgi:ABC-type multidrug transport system ATPase subunit